jgi:tetratricopeptide (TPR) repeat protein
MVEAGLVERANTRGSLLLRVLLVLVAVAALARIVSFAISDQVAVDQPELALMVDGGNWKALMARAERALKEERSEEALRDAQSALRADSLAAGALRVLGVVEEKYGSSDNTERLMRAAADVSRREMIAQAWLLARHLQTGDLPEAMSRLDLIFRTQNSALTGKLVSLLLPILSHDDARRELAKLLATRPPWRSNFLTQVSQEAQDPNAVSALYSALGESPAPPLTEELRPFLDRLIRTGRVEEAYVAWMQSLPPERLSGLGYLYNAGFEYPVTNLPFDWVFARLDSAVVELNSKTNPPLLQVAFIGGRVSQPLVSHLLALPPGTYQYTGRERSDALANERGLRWRIFCLDQPDGSLAETPPLLGDTSWRDFAVTFDVGIECPVQKLQLELPARVTLEQEVSGEASFASLSIAKP